jgi:hypothetical protein
MEERMSSEMLANVQQVIWHYIPEDRTLHNHCCENLKSYNFYNLFWLAKRKKKKNNSNTIIIEKLSFILISIKKVKLSL